VRPEHGGRLELKLSAADATTARYALVIFTPTGECEALATLDSANVAAELGAWQGEAPPAWLEAFARALLRTVARNKGVDGEWPRRVTRWRPDPGR